MTIQLLIRGNTKTLHVECEGQVELPGSSAFPDIAGYRHHARVGPHVGEPLTTVRCLVHAEWAAPVLAWDGGQAVAATVRCVEMDWSRGLQVTRSWSEPLRRANVNEQCLLYRPTPRHQQIRGMTNRYVLAADRWEPAAVPEEFRRKAGWWRCGTDDRRNP